MHVDNFVAKQFNKVLEAQELDIQVAVNDIVKSGVVNLSGSYVDEWVGFNLSGQEFDANFFLNSDNQPRCQVYPVHQGETITNVKISAAVVLH